MEFYFSDANLHKDRFLKQQLQETSDGCEIIFMLCAFYSRMSSIFIYFVMYLVIIADRWLRMN